MTTRFAAPAAHTGAADLGLLRDEFPALARYAWFNTPGVPPAARSVVEAMNRASAAWLDGSFEWLDWEMDAETCRTAFAHLLGVAPETIALQTSLAEAAGTIANSLAASTQRGEVVVPAREFRSNLLPWQRLADAGFSVRLVSSAPARSWTETLIDAIGSSTRLVALSEVQSATGDRADVRAVLDRCERVGARLFLNGTQSVGALALHSWHADVDYFAAHSYKWMLAPRGATFLYVRPDRLAETRPLSPNWKSVSAPYDELYGTETLTSRASRLDASLAWMSWAGARAAMELLTSVPAEVAERQCLRVAAELRRGLTARGFDVRDGGMPSQIVSVRSPDEALAQALKRERVTVSIRDGYLRFGCHFFNTLGDVARVLEVIDSYASD